MPKFAAILTFVFSLIITTNAMPFEADGLHSGMKEAKALEALSEYGDPQIFDKGTDPKRGLKSYIISSESGGSRQVIFCKGSLVFYGTGQLGDFHMFMRILDWQTRIYGTAQTFHRVEETENGPASTLVFKWLGGDESVELIFWQIANQETKINERFTADNDCGLDL